ncbi:hypothetical protein G7046_g2811 [Stylonectria norvegica]|nr:hypothetical protein G7046_g2811 [Stylonectria norvegica]
MKFQRLLHLAVAGLAAAQSDGSNTSLADALSSQNSTLSVLNSLLQSQPSLASALANITNITILAPSNDALNAFLNNSAVTAMVAADSGLVPAILSYHVLNGTYLASDFSTTPMFIESLLANQTYENVTGGQVVEALAQGDTVSFYSALKSESNNLNFTGGVIHIINEVLQVPQNLTATAVAANLTAVTGALTQANLGTALDEMRDITVFAPSNAAFAAIGSVVGNLSTDDLSSILSYHVVPRTIGYSSTLRNTTLRTAEGTDLKITVVNGTVYVNEAKVTTPDVLIANGVVHVIDNVLNPNNTAATPNPSTKTPAFSGASTASGGGVPFTSNVAVATSAATGLATSSSTQGGNPQATAAMAFGALFGGAALVMNV